MAIRYSDDDKNTILAALVENDGNIARTAEQFGVSRVTLRKWARPHRQPPSVAPAPEAEEPDGPELTYRQQAFVQAYLIERFNGTKAARRAGYGGDDATLAVIASVNIRKPKIRAAIDALMDEGILSAKQVLFGLTQFALASIGDFYSIDELGKPRLDLIKAANDGKLHLIKKITFHELTGHIKSIEIHDPLAAHRDLGRYYKLFTDRIEIYDWRKEAEEAGLNAGELFQQLVNQLATNLAAGAGPDDVGGGTGG